MCKFYVVEFEDGVQVVPENWVQYENKCYWPPAKSNEHYLKLVMKCRQPESSWATYPIKKTFGCYDTFEKAKKKLKLSEKQSDLNTSDEELKENRKKRCRILFDEVSETDSEDNRYYLPKTKPFPKIYKTKDVKKIPPESKKQDVFLKGVDVSRNRSDVFETIANAEELGNTDAECNISDNNSDDMEFKAVPAPGYMGDKSNTDNRANQMNPNNDAYSKARKN